METKWRIENVWPLLDYRRRYATLQEARDAWFSATLGCGQRYSKCRPMAVEYWIDRNRVEVVCSSVVLN